MRAFARVGCAAIAGLMSIALVVGGPGAELAFALGASAFPALLIAIGAEPRRSGSRRLHLLLGVLVVLLSGSVLSMLALRGSVVPGEGWPPVAVVLLLGLWLMPLFVVGLGYAALFDRHTLSAADLELFRRRAFPTGDRAEGGAGGAMEGGAGRTTESATEG